MFPGFPSHFELKDEAAISEIIAGKNNANSFVGVFFRNGDSTPPNSDIILEQSDIHHVGTFAEVRDINRTEGGAQLSLFGHRRISLVGIDTIGPPTFGRVLHWTTPLQKISSDTIKAYVQEIFAIVRELARFRPALQDQILAASHTAPINFSDPYQLADFACSVVLSAEGADLQRALSTENIEERLAIVMELLIKDREIVRLQKEIMRQAEMKMSKTQRDYNLREQLKVIKKELGEKDNKEDLVEKYTEQLKVLEEGKLASDAILSVLKEEIKKLDGTEKISAEFHVIRTYLDWLFAIPWGKVSQDILKLQSAKKVLDEDHYGLKEIKTRILEFIAVGKLKGGVSGKIICFIGPPGVGKTSIAKSIARALDRKFYRMSVGGLTDTAEIKGHRRSYIGALPGKPIQSLKMTGVMNPLILIDEIDKVSRSYSGDPASALLELLDPNQNSSFVDNYIDAPVDFSNALFICTANDESTIPAPLKDRMEIIRLSGYDIQEKIAIAQQYLVPKATKEAGLEISDDDKQSPLLSITEDALRLLIKNYCRESGVRSLEKMVEKIVRKIAFEIISEIEKEVTTNTDDSSAVAKSSASSKETGKVDAVVPPVHNILTQATPVTIQVDNLEKYVGKPVFAEETIYSNSKDDQSLPVGVVMGLGWNPLGGSPIFIETAATPCSYSERDSGLHMVTGQLGEVMRESVNIAYTNARKYIAQFEPANKFFQMHQIHLHAPEGATSKDGPSAGVAMTTSFVRYLDLLVLVSLCFSLTVLQYAVPA